MRRSVVLLWFVVSAIVGCGKGDPPCPPNAREVYLQEADEALARKARRLEAEGKTGDLAVTLMCGYDKLPDGTYRKADEVRLLFGDILWCLETMGPKGIPLAQCIGAAARSHFAGMVLGGDMSIDVMLQVTQKITCIELSRNVDLDAEKHGLQRTGPGDWIPAVIWGVIQTLDAAAAPITAPAMFLIKPGSGVEEACVDAPAVPAKKCADTSGCGDRPSGAEDAGAAGGGGGELPPGTDPGPGGGDHF